MSITAIKHYDESKGNGYYLNMIWILSLRYESKILKRSEKLYTRLLYEYRK